MAMMIQKFHRLIASKLFWGVFLALVAFSMVFFGTILPTDDYDAQAAAAAEGELFGEPVNYQEFRDHFNQAYLRILFQTFPQAPRRSPEFDAELRKLAWRRMAGLKKAEELGLTATREEIVEAIKNHQLFGNGSRFSQVTYNAFVQQVLPQIGINEVQFEQHIRQELLLQKLRYLVYQATIVPPDTLKRAYRNVNDSFVLEYATVEREDVAREVEVTEEDARAFFESDPGAFEIPEKVKVRFVQFDVEEFLPEVEIEESEALAFYEENTFLYTLPEEEAGEEDAGDEVTVEEMAEDDADAVEVEVVEADLPEEEAAQTEGPGEEATAAGDETEEEAEEEFAVAEFDVDDLESMADDLLEEQGPAVQPFEDVAEDVYRRLRLERARELAANKAADFVVSMASSRLTPGIGFDEAAERFERTIIDIEPFTQGEELHGIDAGAAFVSEAFNLAPNPDENFSNAISGGRSVYVLNLVERIPARIPAFEEVENRARTEAREAAIEEALVEKARALRTATLEDSFEAAAAAEGLDTTTTEPFSSITGSDDPAITPALMGEIVFLNPGEISEPVPTEGGLIVARVVEREAGDPSGFATARQQMEGSYRRMQLQSLYESWEEQLLSEAGFKDRLDETGEEAEPDAPETGGVET